MAEAKRILSVFRPLHHATFEESPFHEWAQGEAQAKADRERIDVENKDKLDKENGARSNADRIRKKREQEAADEQARIDKLNAPKPKGPIDENQIPTMAIDVTDPPLVDIVMPDPDIYLVHLDDFKANGKLPVFPDKCIKLKDIDLRNSFLVYLSHAWVELPGKTISRRIVRKEVIKEVKPDISGFYFDGEVEESSEEEEEKVISRPATPDGCAKTVTIADNFGNGKWELYCQALDECKREFAPEMENLYIWMDISCVPKPQPVDPKDPDVTIGQQLNSDTFATWSLLLFNRIMMYMDCMLTCVLDDDYTHTPWQLINSGEGLHKDYQAKGWHRYLSRRWCRLEMGYCSNIPFPTEEEYQHHAVFDRRMNPLVGKGVMRADRLGGGVQYERLQARRAHLLYGTREHVTKSPPMILPTLSASIARRDFSPMEGLYSRAGDGPVLDRLNRELWPFTRKGEAGYEGERDNRGSVGQVGFRHGQGKMDYPNGNSYQGKWYHGDMQGEETTNTYIHNNGEGIPVDVYVGSMLQNLQHGGHGTYTRWDGATYRGDWQLGKRHGIGTFKWPDGSSYRGYWQEDERHGNGDLVLSTGATFSGMWQNGKRCGAGVMRWPDGSYYNGEWKFDKRDGYGTYWTPYARGHLYVGYWANGMKEGRGKMTIGGGIMASNKEFSTQVEWLSAQGLDKEILDGEFMGGNFVQEADYAGDEKRLLAEASVAFEIDSDEERRLEAESYAQTELRLQREREMGIAPKKDPALLAAATIRLAAAAKRRAAQRRGEAVAVLNLDEFGCEINGDGDGEGGSARSKGSAGTGAASLSQAEGSSYYSLSRRNSLSLYTPLATPRDMSSAEVRAAWSQIDRLEENLDHYSHDPSPSTTGTGISTSTRTDATSERVAALLDTLILLYDKYLLLATVYSDEGNEVDACNMRDRAKECMNMHHLWLHETRTGKSGGRGGGGGSIKKKGAAPPQTPMPQSQLQRPDKAEGKYSENTSVNAIVNVNARGRDISSAFDVPSSDDDDDDESHVSAHTKTQLQTQSQTQSQTQRAHTLEGWTPSDIAVRRHSLSATPLLLTPRHTSSPAIQAQWERIDSMENAGMGSDQDEQSGLMEKSDFFFLSRLYKDLSDMYRNEGPSGYRDAIETRQRAIACIAHFSDFPRNASENEKKYFLSLTSVLQHIKDELAHHEMGGSHASKAAREEIHRILYDKNYHKDLARKEAKARGESKGDMWERDKNGYKVVYPHDYDNYYP